MSVIKEELSLFDKFSSVFDKFLNLGNKAAAQSEAVQAATEQMSTAWADSAAGMSYFESAYQRADEAIKKAMGTATSFADELKTTGQSVADYEQYWTQAVGNMDKSLLASQYTMQELADKGYIAQQAITSLTDSAEALASAQAEAETQTRNGTEAQRAMAQTIQNEAVSAYEAASAAVDSAATPLERYTAELKQTENALQKNSAKLQEASTEYSRLVRSEGAAAEATIKQKTAVEQLTAQTFKLLNNQRDLKQKLDELAQSGDKAGKAIKSTGEAADKAASGGFSNLLKKLTAVAAAYLSIQKAKELISDAMTEQTYAVKMQAMFGDDVGKSAMTWVRNTANDLGESVNVVAKATADFAKITTQPVNFDKFAKLADKLSMFSENTDFGQMSEAIQQAFTRGSTRALVGAAKISEKLLDQFKVDSFLEAGDVGGALDALNKAAEAAGMTQEAYEKLQETSEEKWNDFCANMQNGAQQAARGFLDAFAPVFDQINKWLQSEQAQKFFAAISIAARIAGEVVKRLVGIAMGFVNFLVDNMPITIGLIVALGLAFAATGQKAVIAGLKAAYAWAMANMQFILIGALVAGAVAALVYLGEVGKWVALIIGIIVLAYAAWQVAQWALNGAMYACPIVWILIAIIAVIALVVMAIYFWSDAFIAATEWIVGAVFWLGAMFYNVGMGIGNFFIWLWAKIVNGWNYAGAKIMSIFSSVGAGISNFINDVGYWFSSVGVTIANAFISGANAAISAINWIIDAINLIPGVNIGHASTFAQMAAPAKAAAVQATDYTKDFQEWQPDYLEYADMGAAFEQGASYGRSAGEATVGAINGLVDAASKFMAMPGADEAAGNDAFENYADGLDKVGGPGDGSGDVGKVGKVGKVEDAVKLDDDDLKLLVDMAERDYVTKVNVRTLSPNVTVEVNNNNGEPLDEGKIANAIGKILNEQSAMHTDISYTY